jgi:hypothetical protein
MVPEQAIHGNIILATAYLPPINWFRALIRAETVFIESQETYSKQTYRNRCRIYSANGSFNLTIPVSKPFGNHTQTTQITIFNETPWMIKHWRAIESAYNSSPWFLYYKDEFEILFSGSKPESLFAFNLELIKVLMKVIGIYKKLALTSHYEVNPQDVKDLRYLSNPLQANTPFESPPYTQVFENKFGFLPNLSIIDLLFNLGPETGEYLSLSK